LTPTAGGGRSGVARLRVGCGRERAEAQRGGFVEKTINGKATSKGTRKEKSNVLPPEKKSLGNAHAGGTENGAEKDQMGMRPVSGLQEDLGGVKGLALPFVKNPEEIRDGKEEGLGQGEPLGGRLSIPQELAAMRPKMGNEQHEVAEERGPPRRRAVVGTHPASKTAVAKGKMHKEINVLQELQGIKAQNAGGRNAAPRMGQIGRERE
jgi:hypothetical protein